MCRLCALSCLRGADEEINNVSSTNSEQSKLCINVQRTIDNKPETLSIYVEKSRWLEHFRTELITNWHIQSTIKKIRNKNVATKQIKHKIT